MTATCPLCGCDQAEGLLCHDETSRLERELGDVAAIVAELDITLSKQARIGTPGKSGLARERIPINVGGIDPRWVLDNVLTTWARDIMGYPDAKWNTAFVPNRSPATTASRVLLSNVALIRRHPAVEELVDEITDAVHQARRAVDRPADWQYLGQCLVPTPDEDGRDVTCLAEIYARPAARETTCKICGVTHDVVERRKDLLDRSEDMLFTVQEAAQMLGSYGNLTIGQSTIRGYISKGQLGYHGKVAGSSVIRLGDLMGVIATNAAKPTRKLRPAV